ncbi:unnamed protein product, partial [Acanthoscelides obtectus]
NKFDICAQTFLLEEEVNKTNELSLRTAAIKHSVGTGQGFFKSSRTKKISTYHDSKRLRHCLPQSQLTKNNTEITSEEKQADISSVHICEVPTMRKE